MSADTATSAAPSANGKDHSKDSKESSQSVQLFQRAHQKMVILQRVEEQVQQLLNQRRSIQDELRGIQVQINEEFDRLLRAGNGSAASASAMNASRILGELSEDLKPVGVGADE